MNKSRNELPKGQPVRASPLDESLLSQPMGSAVRGRHGFGNFLTSHCSSSRGQVARSPLPLSP